MLDNKCKICGGDLLFSVHSEYASCENCGNNAEIDLQELGRIRRIYESAERKMRLNSKVGYKDAIIQLRSISFVSEAKEKISFCENRLREIAEAEAKRAETEKENAKSETKTGIIVIILLLLVVLALIAGAVYIIIHLVRGDLSPTAIAVIVSVIVFFIIITVIGKIRS